LSGSKLLVQSALTTRGTVPKAEQVTTGQLTPSVQFLMFPSPVTESLQISLPVIHDAHIRVPPMFAHPALTSLPAIAIKPIANRLIMSRLIINPPWCFDIFVLSPIEIVPIHCSFSSKYFLNQT